MRVTYNGVFVKIQAGKAFLQELHDSEYGAYEDALQGSEGPNEGEPAVIKLIKAIEAQESWKTSRLEVDLETARYIQYAIQTNMDKWQGFVSESIGSGHLVKSALNLDAQLKYEIGPYVFHSSDCERVLRVFTENNVSKEWALGRLCDTCKPLLESASSTQVPTP